MRLDLSRPPSLLAAPSADPRPYLRSLRARLRLATDPTLEQQIRASKDLIPLATQLSTLSSESQDGTSSVASREDGSDDGEADGGEGEIRALARTVLDLLEAGQ